MTPNNQYNRRASWKAVTVTPSGPVAKEVTPTASELLAAAAVFDGRHDSFAAGKGDICRDLADKVKRFGSYASEKQQGFAAKLVEWSKPRERAWNPDSNTLSVPDLFAVMQKHSTFYVDPLRISRKNQNSLCWLVYKGNLVGKLEDGKAIVFPRKAADAGTSVESMLTLLREFEANPLAAAMKYGKLAGRCCSCGRDLTDPESIERGIGPICAGKF